MGYHNILIGEDLHEPSRIRVVNNILIDGQTVSLVPGDLVKISVTSTFNVLNIEAYALENDTEVVFIDTVIGGGDEGTAVLIGRVINVPIDVTSNFATGDILKVGPNHTLVKGSYADGRVATVLSRTANSNVMDIIFNSTSSVPHHLGAAVYLTEPILNPRNSTLTIPAGSTTATTGRKIFGWDDFGVGLDHTSGNASFSFQTEAKDDGGLGSRDAIDILEDGTYEISLDPYIFFPGVLGASSNITGVVHTVTNAITLIITGSTATDDEEQFTNTVSLSATLAPVSTGLNVNSNFPGTTSEEFELHVPARILAKEGRQSRIVGLKAGDKVSLGMETTFTRTLTSVSETITLTYTAENVSNPTSRSQSFICGMRFKRLF